MDMCLAEIIGRKASASTRPRMDALATWFTRRAHIADRVEACVFANVAAGHETRLASWVANLRGWGWSVFVKPKQHRHDDIDDEMVRHIDRHFRQGTLVELVVASHDGRAFTDALRRYVEAGVQVTVLGFRERMSIDLTTCGAEFLDLEFVPGVFIEPLPRTNLFDLPPGGRWFASLTPLEGVLPVAIPEEPPIVEAPVPDLDRADVVAFVRGALQTATGAELSLQAAGDLLRREFPGFSLEGSGYVSVSDLLDELQASGDVRVTKSDHGHLLRAVPVNPASDTGPDAAGLVIDLDAPEHRVAEPVIDLDAAAPGHPTGPTGPTDDTYPTGRGDDGGKPGDRNGGGKHKNGKHKDGKNPAGKHAGGKNAGGKNAGGKAGDGSSGERSAAATNPIYRMFGFDPSPAG